VYRQEILIVDFADAAISPAAASYRTEGIYTLKILFQHNGVVIEIRTVSAALPICFFLCPKKHPVE
jgi:hypothetical protein